jgi:hypothetical protein
MQSELAKLFQSSVGIWEIIVPVGFSLIAAVVIYFMYQIFYGSKHIGAGVHRTFLIGGPAITTVFIGIQTSIPLSLGLLGALSFVRFRTPVKDPAEIGFLLLLIASSIGAATKNYLITAILFAAVFLALGIQWLARNRSTAFNRSYLIISMEQAVFQVLDPALRGVLQERLGGPKLQTTSLVDGRISLHYQYRRKAGFDAAAFSTELNKLSEGAKIEVFIS